MLYHMYVSLQDDDEILILTMDSESGQLTPKAELALTGGPSSLAINPDRNALYIGHRTSSEISSHRIDQVTGGLTQNGKVSLEASPTYLSTDRKGKYLLSAHYQGAHVAVHPIGDEGSVGAPPIEWLATDTGAHAIQTDPSNKFAFVPHIARLNDNVMQPAGDAYGPNVIFQFKFDEWRHQPMIALLRFRHESKGGPHEVSGHNSHPACTGSHHRYPVLNYGSTAVRG